MARTKLAGQNQMREWINLVKRNPATYSESEAQIVKDFTLRYDPVTVTIENDNDLVTKKYVDDAKSISLVGNPTDGTFSDGILELTPTTLVSDATDQINELLAELAPANADTLSSKDLTNAVAKYSGFLADSVTAAYKAGDSAGASVSYVVKNNMFTLSTPATTTAINNGDAGQLNLYINNVQVDSFDLEAAFVEANRNGAQPYTQNGGGAAEDYTSPNGFIIINSVAKYNNFKKWQKCVATLNIFVASIVEGYNYIQLKHEGLVTNQASNNWLLFCDKDGGSNPSVSGVSLATGSLNSNKYLSGVRFYGLTDTVNIGATGSNLFNNVYVGSPLAYSGFTGIASGSIAVNDAAVSGVANPPAVGNTMTLANKTLTLTTANQCTDNARISIIPSDPYGSYTAVQSAAQAILVNTYADGASGLATVKYDPFTNEYYRLPLSFDSEDKVSAVTGLWNSQTALENGNAQVYLNSNAPALTYPVVNLSAAKPAQAINYSGFNGVQKYMRCLQSVSSQTSVTLQLDGVTGGIGTLGAGDINIEIKLPSQTAWIDAAKAYNPGQGVGTDGFGCLNGAITYGANASMTLTFGGKATYDSANRMYVRITLRNSNRIIKAITCVGW